MHKKPGLFVGKHGKQTDVDLSMTQEHNCEATGLCDKPAVVTVRSTLAVTEFSHGSLRPQQPRADGSDTEGGLHLDSASGMCALDWFQIQECLAGS